MNDAAIRTTVAVSFCYSAKNINDNEKQALPQDGICLALWISDSTKKSIPLGDNIIREKP